MGSRFPLRELTNRFNRFLHRKGGGVVIWKVLLIALLAFGLGLNVGRLLASWQEQTKDRDDEGKEGEG